MATCGSEVRLVGGTRAFRRFLAAALGKGVAIRTFATPAAALAKRPRCRAYVLLPDYENGARCVQATDFDTLRCYSRLRRQGQRLYPQLNT
jgi:hypothetical protein